MLEDIKRQCINEYLNLLSNILIEIDNKTANKIIKELEEIAGPFKKETPISETLEKQIINNIMDVLDINNILEEENILIYETVNEYENSELTIKHNNKTIWYEELGYFTGNEIGLNTIQI